MNSIEKSNVQFKKDTCVRKVIPALFIIAQNLGKTALLINKGMAQKLWCINTI